MLSCGFRDLDGADEQSASKDLISAIRKRSGAARRDAFIATIAVVVVVVSGLTMAAYAGRITAVDRESAEYLTYARDQVRRADREISKAQDESKDLDVNACLDALVDPKRGRSAVADTASPAVASPRQRFDLARKQRELCELLSERDRWRKNLNSAEEKFANRVLADNSSGYLLATGLLRLGIVLVTLVFVRMLYGVYLDAMGAARGYNAIADTLQAGSPPVGESLASLKQFHNVSTEKESPQNTFDFAEIAQKISAAFSGQKSV